MKPNTCKLLPLPLLLFALTRFPPTRSIFFSSTPRPPRGRDMHASRYLAERRSHTLLSRRNARRHLHGVAAFCAAIFRPARRRFASPRCAIPGHPPVVVQLEYACRRRFCPAGRARQHSNFIGSIPRCKEFGVEFFFFFLVKDQEDGYSSNSCLEFVRD